jgi:hypothetical protein
MCSIDVGHFPFVPTLRYDALSYTWDSKKESRSIFCNSASHTVTENLYQTLHCLQARDHRLASQDHRYIWVDAICINQADPQEIQAQVSLMLKIYQGAQNVVIWLGESNPSSPNSFQDSTLLYVDLVWYTSHPYWTRLWALQEILHSNQKSVLIGDPELDWDHFWGVIISAVAGLGKFANQSQLQPALEFHSLLLSINALKILLKEPTLAQPNPTLLPLARAEFRQLTTFAKGLHTTEPRDMIYAWSGLVGVLGINLPSPDYTTPVEMIFQKAKNILFQGYLKAKADKTVDFKTVSQVSKNQPHGIFEKVYGSIIHASLVVRTKSSSTKLPPTLAGHALLRSLPSPWTPDYLMLLPTPRKAWRRKTMPYLRALGTWSYRS